jgi:hypothetical protein
MHYTSGEWLDACWVHWVQKEKWQGMSLLAMQLLLGKAGRQASVDCNVVLRLWMSMLSQRCALWLGLSQLVAGARDYVVLLLGQRDQALALLGPEARLAWGDALVAQQVFCWCHHHALYSCF